MAQAKPMLDRKAAEQINLNVLKRMDPQVEELLATAAHVALYDFDVDTKKWARKEVEGSLFLVKRSGSPRFRIVIMNKKSDENFAEDVGGGFNCEVNKPYLLYRNKAGEVIGIWFYEEADCDRMAALLQRIASTFAAPSDAAILEGGDGSVPSSPPAASYTAPAAASSSVTSHPVATTEDSGAGGVEEDSVFWDRRVQVPADIGMPNRSGDDNPLAKVFAGMKVAPSEQPQQPQQMTHVPLLTPQFLLQQQVPKVEAPAPAQSASHSQSAANQGAALLQSLRRVESSTSSARPGSVAPPSTAKISALLRGLAENESFCAELAIEMQRAGFS